MYFKLQKDHEQFTDTPQPVHGLRVKHVGSQSIVAEIALCFQYDAENKVFNLFSKRQQNDAPARYDLLTTAKINSVWSIEMSAEKSRRLLSAVLENPRGESHVFSMPYAHNTPVSLQSILPLSATAPKTQVEEAAPAETHGPLKTLVRMWYEFRAKKQKAAQQRRK